MENFTEANGIRGKGMDAECSIGPMAQSTSENGMKTRFREWASFGMQTEIYSRESSRTRRPTASESTFMRTELSMKESGRMTFNMALAKKFLRMEVSITAITKMGRWTDMG